MAITVQFVYVVSKQTYYVVIGAEGGSRWDVQAQCCSGKQPAPANPKETEFPLQELHRVKEELGKRFDKIDEVLKQLKQETLTGGRDDEHSTAYESERARGDDDKGKQYHEQVRDLKAAGRARSRSSGSAWCWCAVAAFVWSVALGWNAGPASPKLPGNGPQQAQPPRQRMKNRKSYAERVVDVLAEHRRQNDQQLIYSEKATQSSTAKERSASQWHSPHKSPAYLKKLDKKVKGAIRAMGLQPWSAVQQTAMARIDMEERQNLIKVGETIPKKTRKKSKTSSS